MTFENTLKQTFLFRNFSPMELQAIAHLCHKRQVKKGEILFETGEVLLKMHVIVFGTAVLTIEKKDGIEDPVTIAGNEQIIGFEGFYDPGNTSLFTARALESCEVLEINYAELEELFIRNPLMAQKGLRSFQKFYSNIIQTLAGKLTESRMAKFF